jgi:hypothetical protein
MNFLEPAFMDHLGIAGAAGAAENVLVDPEVSP